MWHELSPAWPPAAVHLPLIVSSLLPLPKRPSFPLLLALSNLPSLKTNKQTNPLTSFFFFQLKVKLYWHHPIPQLTTPPLCSHFIATIIPHMITSNCIYLRLCFSPLIRLRLPYEEFQCLIIPCILVPYLQCSEK